MSTDVIADRETGSSSALPQTTASELIDGVDPGQSFNAQSILRRNPQAAAERSTVVDLAYEEYCRKKDAGKQLDIRVFAERFPDIEQSLIRVLEVHEYLEQNPDANFNEKPEWPKVNSEYLGFHLLAEIGRGAFSRVFLAEEIELGNRQVVVKVCEYANDEPAKLGQLEHPNIVPVHSVQTNVLDGRTTICMPFLANATLWDVMGLAFEDGQQPKSGEQILAAAERANCQYPPPEEEVQPPRAIRDGSYGEAVIELGAQICDALTFAHGKKILHCDIKPSNVLITARGQSKLFDFNLSRHQDVDDQTLGGTLPYMAPEQVKCMIETRAENLPTIDHRTDLFSLGVTLFQLLTGKLPFSMDELTGSRSRNARDLLAKQRAGDISVVQLEQAVDRTTARLILDCLAFEPEARPESAASLARALRSRLSPQARTARWVRSHKLTTTAVILILCELALGAGFYFALRPSAGLLAFTAGVKELRQGKLSVADRYFSAAADAGYEAEEIKWWKEEKGDLWREVLSHHDFDAALFAIRQGDNQHAIEQFTAAIRSGYEPKDVALLLRGWAWWGKGDVENAKVDFEESYELGGSHEALASIAYHDCIQGIYPRAKDEFEELFEAGFITPSVLNNLAVCHFRLRDSIETGNLLEQAIERAPDQWILHLNMALVELRRSWRSKGSDWNKHMDLALGHIAKSKELGAPLVEIEFRLACVHAAAMERADASMKEDHRRRALAACEKALTLGMSRQGLGLVESNYKALKNDKQFISLKEQTRPSTIEMSPMVLMDIYPDIIAPLVAEG